MWRDASSCLLCSSKRYRESSCPSFRGWPGSDGASDWPARGKTAGVRFDRIDRIDSALWTCHFSSSWRSLQAGLGQLWELTRTLFRLDRCVSRPQVIQRQKRLTCPRLQSADLDSTLSSRGRANVMRCALLLHRWSELNGEAAGGNVQVQFGDPTAWFANGSGLIVLCTVGE
jgi:hypothetical protein